MANEYDRYCDDFYVNARLGSQMPLPQERGTLLHFFEQVQKAFPGMTRFRRGDGDLSIEEDRTEDCYRWVNVESQRLGSGHVNPESVDEAMRLHRFVLELAPFELGISPVEIDYLDVLFGFDLEYKGNHDEIIADALLEGGPLGCLLEAPGARPVDIQPSITVALSEDCRAQARLEVVTRTSSYQVRTGEYSPDMISVYLIARQYWGERPRRAPHEVVDELRRRCETLAEQYVIGRVLRPLHALIVSRS